ncbi:gamma-carboxygeranoyl-CoA hydratase [Photobacterium angustum]|nr:gamma-carboxygeranoyl-CoA hydratase [Photobacterium angustum]KJG32006.1 gamma-carboxygeranoyl-CoA hydratase [Photobacterium angustum]PSV66309.1 gamma-carboxygeranoyl-CoA hydratase [Photobacterium angustum]PSW91660.1 gamma-carboxygeranoyl-CoA hydratase [Photobacterium angustum]
MVFSACNTLGHIMKTQPNILVSVSPNNIATITLNRVDKSNAFNAEIIGDLLTALNQLKINKEIRGLILEANGKHFSSGADLHWMKNMALETEQNNQKDAAQLAELLNQLNHFPAPTIAVVQGAAFGGALGLICCCDIAIASINSKFCLSEVKLGLVPATIAPYVCRAMGIRQAKRFMLTAELITVEQALELGLIHHICDDIQQEKQVIIQQILSNSPAALATVKTLCRQCEIAMIDQSLIQYTSKLIARVRCSPQAQEGIQAFFDKVPPSWSKVNDINE